MKKYHKYIALAALTFSFAACTQDEDFIPQGDGDAIKISASIGALQTRVSYDAKGYTTFDKGDQIRVKNTLCTSKNIATYTLTDEGWNTADAFVWSSTSLNQFEAWYPVTDGTSFDTFTLPTEQNTSALLGAADWMTIGTKEIEKPSDKTLKLHFLHMLTKVTVNVTSWGSEYDGTDKTIEDVKIYSLATDIVQDREGLIGQIKTASLTPIAPLADGNSYTAIVCPGLYSSDQKFMTFTVNGTDNLTVLAKVSSPIEIEAAKHYTFNLTVGKETATISSVEVIPWAKKEIVGGVAEEVKVEIVIEGSTATITIPDVATDAMVQNAVTEALADNATLLMTNDQLTDAQQTAIATALTGKSDIALVMGGVTAPTTAITELADIDLAYKNGTGENGHVVVADGYIVTSKAGLDAWRTAATSDVSTNLTLACDIEYNANWSMLDITYNGTIDGNGYSIVGLNCSTTSLRTAFVYTLGSEGVIKHLGMVGGSFSRSRSSSAGGSAVFLWVNEGIIMGCYNTSSCTCPGGENEYSGYASGISNSNYGKIIACYNAGTISAACDPGSGINRYNKGVISCCYNTGEVSGYGVSLGYVVAAITSVNYATINDCYYTKPSKGFENESSGTATNITKVTGSDWTNAMNKMNAAIEAYNADEANTVKCNYRYVLNTDAATKEAQPLVIVEAPATE